MEWSAIFYCNQNYSVIWQPTHLFSYLPSGCGTVLWSHWSMCMWDNFGSCDLVFLTILWEFLGKENLPIIYYSVGQKLPKVIVWSYIHLRLSTLFVTAAMQLQPIIVGAPFFFFVKVVQLSLNFETVFLKFILNHFLQYNSILILWYCVTQPLITRWSWAGTVSTSWWLHNNRVCLHYCTPYCACLWCHCLFKVIAFLSRDFHLLALLLHVKGKF